MMDERTKQIAKHLRKNRDRYTRHAWFRERKYWADKFESEVAGFNRQDFFGECWPFEGAR